VTNRTAYRCGAARVAVETEDRDTFRWLAEFVTPWFEPCPVLSSSCNVRFTASRIDFESIERQYSTATTRPIPCFALDSEVVQLAGWSEAGTTVVADTELGSFYRVSATAVEVIARPEFPRARIGLMRVVREVLVASAKAADRLLDLHAAAFATSAGAVLLVGPKQAGKTTLLTHFLRCKRASLIANDRVLVDVGPASPIAFGVPTLVSVRVGTLELFPNLRRTANERPALFHSDESPEPTISDISDGGPSRHFGLSPAQLAQRCGSGTTDSAPVAAIVFPEMDMASAGWLLEPVAIEAGSNQLLDSRYGIRAIRQPRTIFADMVGRREPRGDDAATQVARLSAAAPLFRCRLSPGAYRNAADDLLRAVLGARVSTERVQ
jgi:hypothetical protein